MKTTDDAAKYKHTHVMRRWSEVFNRCIWCGYYERRAPLADVLPILKPTVYTGGVRAATDTERAAVNAMFEPSRVPRSTIETVFASMAREYAAQSERLQQWVRAGNQLPKVYRA